MTDRPAARSQCAKVLKNGKQCKYKEREDTAPYCHMHDPKLAQYFENFWRGRE